MSEGHHSYKRKIELIDSLIETCEETIVKARKHKAHWLVEEAQKELLFAKYEKEKAFKEMMEGRF